MKRHAAILAALCLAASVAAADIPGLGTYSYDGSGNITAIGSQTYRYDAFGRLTKATVSLQNEQTYTYDRYGNLVTIGTKLNGVTLQSQRPAVNPCTNRIQLENIPGCANASNYNVVGTYDAAGNVLALEGNSFEYDVLNTTIASTVAGVRRVHLYTASGERVASVTMNGSAPLRWDWTLRDSSNRVLRRLSFQGNVWRWEEDYIYASGKLIAAAVPTPEKLLHFHTDHLGTPRLITGNGGARVSEHNYFPFGREVPSTSQQSTAIPAFDEAKKFTGHERDAATLDYMHARYYATYLGRFLSADPTWESADLSKPQSWNRYSYVMNKPVDMVDPDGKQAAPGEIYVNGRGWTAQSPLDPEHRPTPQMAVQYMVVTGAIVGAFLMGTILADVAIAPDACACDDPYQIDDSRITRLSDDRIIAPPNKRGNAPRGDDGHPVEIHHDGQEPDSPLKEMTRTEHRGAGNFKPNHENTGQQPSKIDRKSWVQAVKDYWRGEWDSHRFEKEKN